MGVTDVHSVITEIKHRLALCTGAADLIHHKNCMSFVESQKSN